MRLFFKPCPLLCVRAQKRWGVPVHAKGTVAYSFGGICPVHRMSGPQRKLWIDTDCGVDDAIGILLALADPSATLLAASSVSGNADSKQVAMNIGRVLGLVDRSDIPIYLGSNEPLFRPRKSNPGWYGVDGLGDAPHVRPRPVDVRPPSPGSAAVKLVDCATENDGALTVIALGPLTNIALALKLDPLLPSRLDQLVIMGSAGEEKGTEFNFCCDPEAAKIVFDKFGAASATGQPSSVVLVAMDVCSRNSLPWPIWDSVLGKRESQKARFLSAITEQCVPAMRASNPQGWNLSDVLAVAVALQPGIVESLKQVAVDIEVQGSDLVAGMALFDYKCSHRNVQLVTGTDASAFFAMCMRSLE